jgi:excisionase family DNA binding protein
METQMQLPTYTTRLEASVRLKCSIRTIDRMIKDCRIKAFKLNRRVLIYLNSLTEECLNATKPKFLN